MIIEKIKDASGFIRADHRAIISVDNKGLNSYKNQKQKSNEIYQAISDINKLKEDMHDIKTMLNLLIKAKNG